MRVLWATLHSPHPTRGGGWSHSWELLSQLGRRHRIRLLCAGFEPDRVPAEVAELGVEARGVGWVRHRPAGRAGLVWEALRGPGGEDLRAVMPAVRALAPVVADEQRRRSYDLLFLWGAELAPLLDGARLPSAHYVTDANTRYARRRLRTAPSLRHRLLYALDAAHVERWERTRYRAATALATTSETERATLERLTRRHFEIVPVALGRDWFDPPHTAREHDLVTIVAGLDYWPNVEGIRWFVRACWPRVRAALPAARLRVVGRSPSDELRGELEAMDIGLLADVPDARPHYWRAGVIVIPLRIGSGVKNKLIHAFACGAPVVATSVAVEGTETIPGDHALVADDPAGLADAVIEVRRACSARRLAEAYRAEPAAEALERFWQRTVTIADTAGAGTRHEVLEQLDVRAGAHRPREGA
jgi:glycosyltransferase involved in cell wall biosynthesis